MLWPTFLIVSLSLGNNPPVAAQTRPSDTAIRVPLEICRDVPFVWVKVNGKGPFLFLVDTGCTACGVDSELARELGLTNTGQRDVNDQVAGKVQMQTTVIDRIEIGSVLMENLAAFVTDMSMHRRAIPRPVKGTLGSRLFRDGIVTIDYANSALVLEEGSLPPANGRDILPIDLRAWKSIVPVVRVEIAGTPYRLGIDTGNTNDFDLPLALRACLPLKSELSEGSTALSATATGTSQWARLDGDLRLGEHVVTTPPIDFGKGDPVIGGGVLHHFRITFDYSNGRMRLTRPTADPLWIPRNNVGLGVLKRGQQWEVAQVISGSWAEHEGIHSGDVLLTINGAPPDGLACRGWREQLGSRKAIELVFSREGKEYARRVPAGTILSP